MRDDRTPVLEVEDLVAGYAGHPVLHGVTMQVRAGEIVSLLGANGAGKSTLLKTIVGTVPTIRGDIRLHGESIGRRAAWRRVAAGIGFSPENRRVFANLTVRENLRMGAISRSRADEDDGLERALTLFPILRERSGQRAGTLSGGEQQMLAIVRALMAMPSLLLVEEPSQGLAPVVVDDLYAALRAIADTGVAVLVAEQFQQVREDATDRILLIDKGTVVDDADLDAAAVLAYGQDA
jgi:ABC-type branched-subunit amino acid transport system ATPase component